MKSTQNMWSRHAGWSREAAALPRDPDLVLVFGATAALEDGVAVAELRARWGSAPLFGCSTAGEIGNDRVHDDSLVATAVWFDHTQVLVRSTYVGSDVDSRTAGRNLAETLPQEGLSHVMVLSDGLAVNGSELVAGMTAVLPPQVAVTGGLAGDGARFQRTLVLAGDEPAAGQVAAVGLYGDRIRVGYGSLGGWDPFGPERLVTSARGNVLLELDRQPALALYRKYLGEHAQKLPASGLLFPLSVRTREGRTFVRTILAVDDKEQSLTFAGDLPEGAFARLMKANFDRLVDGAHGAARTSRAALAAGETQLAILISCVGRKLVLGQRTEEEVEAVRAVVGPQAGLTGFYSYGEICPAAPEASCELHNQTMTITTLAEV